MMPAWSQGAVAAVLSCLLIKVSQLFQLPLLPDPLRTVPNQALPVMLQLHVLDDPASVYGRVWRERNCAAQWESSRADVELLTLWQQQGLRSCSVSHLLQVCISGVAHGAGVGLEQGWERGMLQSPVVHPLG